MTQMKWNGPCLIRTILELMDMAYGSGHMGPFKIKIAKNYLPWFGVNYWELMSSVDMNFESERFRAFPMISLRERILRIGGVESVLISDKLQEWFVSLESLDENFILVSTKQYAPFSMEDVK